VNGSIYQGYRVPARELSLPVEIRGTVSQSWLSVDRDFWASLKPAEEAFIYVTMPDSSRRYLPVRLERGGDPELEVDPALDAASIYDLEFKAGDPFWRGEHVQVSFSSIASSNLFPGPPFNIGKAATIEVARVTNPGDEHAWPRWVIEGPYSSATVGVGTSVVTLGTPILAGDFRIIDMDPNVRSITNAAGVDKWLEATEAEFEPIPPGTDVALSLALAGATSATQIELHFDARYRRAW
jgi:hypothetical protein